jgi:hypothetical protein
MYVLCTTSATKLCRLRGAHTAKYQPARGSARVADIVSEQEGLETELGVRKIAAGIFTGPAEIANRFIFHRGDIDHGEIARTRQAGQLHGIAAVGFDPIPWFFWG